MIKWTTLDLFTHVLLYFFFNSRDHPENVAQQALQDQLAYQDVQGLRVLLDQQEKRELQ